MSVVSLKLPTFVGHGKDFWIENVYYNLYDISNIFEIFASYMSFLDHHLLHNNAKKYFFSKDTSFQTHQS